MEVETMRPVRPSYRDGQMELDGVRGEVRVNGHKLVLTRKEFELLALLAANEGEILRRDVLMMNIWGYSMQIRTRTLDVHIRRLRAKIGAHGEPCIETIFGVGYRFQRFRISLSRQVFALPMTAAPALA